MIVIFLFGSVLFIFIYGLVKVFYYFKRKTLTPTQKIKQAAVCLVLTVIGISFLEYALPLVYMWVLGIVLVDIFRYLRKNILNQKWQIFFYSMVIAGIGIGYYLNTEEYQVNKAMKVGGGPFPLIFFVNEDAQHKDSELTAEGNEVSDQNNAAEEIWTDFPLPFIVQIILLIVNMLIIIIALESLLLAGMFLRKRLGSGRKIPEYEK